MIDIKVLLPKSIPDFKPEMPRGCALPVSSDPRYAVIPGFCDVHVHLREPGFSYKETIATGSLAAARGGYTEVFAMPNLSPVPDSYEHLLPELELINSGAVISVRPYGALTAGEKGKIPADIEELAPHVVAFSDDGKGVQDEGLMRELMLRCRAAGKILAAHCEDESLVDGGVIHAGAYSIVHSHRGICSESEWRPIERDLRLAAETGVSYHVCHVSCRESVELIRDAKRSGVDVTCETAPHYLLLDDNDLQEHGRFKMNPPLRSARDREALLLGVQDGAIDMIATDHAPHSIEEKSRGLDKSPFGIVGLETAFPLLYTYLVREGVITLDRLLDMMIMIPRVRFGLTLSTGDWSLWDLDADAVIEPEEFLSKGRATPFEQWMVKGRCLLTVKNGRAVYSVFDPPWM